MANLFNDLPIALPHTVAGLALLLAYGRKTSLSVRQDFFFLSLILAMFLFHILSGSHFSFKWIKWKEKSLMWHLLWVIIAQAYF